MIEGVRSRMLDAVRLRLRADVPVGVYLSGGIDSSVIAGMVTHLVKEQGQKMGNVNETERVSCFTIAFDEGSGYDESGKASEFRTHQLSANRAYSNRKSNSATSRCQIL